MVCTLRSMKEVDDQQTMHSYVVLCCLIHSLPSSCRLATENAYETEYAQVIITRVNQMRYMLMVKTNGRSKPSKCEHPPLPGFSAQASPL